jgi:hypothetical protein
LGADALRLPCPMEQLKVLPPKLSIDVRAAKDKCVMGNSLPSLTVRADANDAVHPIRMMPLLN